MSEWSSFWGVAVYAQLNGWLIKFNKLLISFYLSQSYLILWFSCIGVYGHWNWTLILLSSYSACEIIDFDSLKALSSHFKSAHANNIIIIRTVSAVKSKQCMQYRSVEMFFCQGLMHTMACECAFNKRIIIMNYIIQLRFWSNYTHCEKTQLLTNASAIIHFSFVNAKLWSADVMAKQAMNHRHWAMDAMDAKYIQMVGKNINL